MPRHVLAYGAPGDLDAEHQQKLIRDALLAPAGSLRGHPPDHSLQLRRNRWAAGTGLHSPQPLPGAAVPAEQSLRANDDQGVSPIEEFRQQGQSDSGDRIDAAWLDASFDIQSQMSTKDKDSRLGSYESSAASAATTAGSHKSGRIGWRGLCA